MVREVWMLLYTSLQFAPPRSAKLFASASPEHLVLFCFPNGYNPKTIQNKFWITLEAPHSNAMNSVESLNVSISSVFRLFCPATCADACHVVHDVQSHARGVDVTQELKPHVPLRVSLLGKHGEPRGDTTKINQPNWCYNKRYNMV